MMSIVFDEVVTTLDVMVIVLGMGCWYSTASRRAYALLDDSISNQVRRPAELKHLIKQRKRK